MQLEIPLIKNRARILMTDTLRKDEFSHASLHNQKLLMADLKFNNVKQILSKKLELKGVSEKEMQEKEKKQIPQAPKLIEIDADEFINNSRIKPKFNSPRQGSPINAQASSNEAPKQQDIENKIDAKLAIKKKKDQFNIAFQPLNFEPLTRKGSRRALDVAIVNLPQIKAKYSVSPPNQGLKVDKSAPSLFTAAKEPRINPIPKSNIGFALNNPRPTSPINAANQNNIPSRLKTVFQKPPATHGESSSCHSNRPDIIRFKKPEVRVEKSPQNNFVVKQRPLQKQGTGEESFSNVSGCKVNISANSNISFRKASVSPRARLGISPEHQRQQQQKQELLRRQPLSKVIEMRLIMNQEDRDNCIKGTKSKLINASSDGGSKEKLMIQVQEMERVLDKAFDRKKKSPTKSKQGMEKDWIISTSPKDYLSPEINSLEIQTPELARIDENKSIQEESRTYIKYQNIPEITLGRKQLDNNTSKSNIEEEVTNEETTSNSDPQKSGLANLKTQEIQEIDTRKDRAETETTSSSSFYKEIELDFQKQGFKPILEEKLDLKRITQAAKLCSSKINEITHSIQEIDTNPFEVFENEISGIIEGKEDLAFCIPLLILEGLLNK